MASKDSWVQGSVQSIGNTETAQDVDLTSQHWSSSNHHRFAGRRLLSKESQDFQMWEGLDHGHSPRVCFAGASKMTQEGTWIWPSRQCGVCQVKKDDGVSCSWSKQGSQRG